MGWRLFLGLALTALGAYGVVLRAVSEPTHYDTTLYQCWHDLSENVIKCKR
jgi:hypothetical protein